MSEDTSAERFMAMVEKIVETAPDGLDTTGRAALLRYSHWASVPTAAACRKSSALPMPWCLREITAMSGRFLP